MSYMQWAIAGLIGYTIMAPAISIASARTNSEAAILFSNVIFLGGVFLFVLYQGTPVLQYAIHPNSVYTYLAGFSLILGVIGYFRALALGPVSTVVPIVGLYIVFSAIIGIVFLDEALTLRKSLGIVLAFVAILLVSG